MVRLLAQVELAPDTGLLPGGDVLQGFVNGLGGWALVLALASLVVSAAGWALGANSQNHHYVQNGKRGVMYSALAAVLIGGSAAIINFFFGQGQGIT